MKKTRSARNRPEETQSENRFNYRKAKPNRFAENLKGDVRVVVLDPDVAEIFPTAEAVNAILRALIKAMPQKTA